MIITVVYTEEFLYRCNFRFNIVYLMT